MLRWTTLFVLLFPTAVSASGAQETNPAQPLVQPAAPMDEFVKQLENEYPKAADKQGIKAMYRLATCARMVANMRDQLAKSPFSADSKKELEQKIDDFSKSADCGSDIDRVLQARTAPGKLCPNIGPYVKTYGEATAAGIPANPIQVNEKTDKILESLVTKGEEVEGPKRVVLRYINRLRYSFGASVDITIVQNPSPPQAFVVADLVKDVPAGGEPTRDVTKETPAITEERGFDQSFRQIQLCNKDYQKQLASVQDEAKTVMDAVATAKSDYQNALSNSPAVLSQSQAEDLRAEANRLSQPDGSLAAAIEKPYPSDHARAVLVSLNVYLQTLTSLEGTDEFRQWSATGGNAQRYIAEKQHPQMVKESLAKFAPGSEEDKTARADQERIAYWKSRFEAFSRFRIREPVIQGGETIPGVFNEDLALAILTDCHTIFGKGKESKISYTVTDLYGTSNQVVSGAITSVCAPLLTVSAGVGFSTLGTEIPGFVSSASTTTTNGTPTTTVVERIGFTEKSAIKPLYVVQMNAMLGSLSKSWSAYGTLGAAVVTRTDTTTLEWLFGPSMAYKRAFFMTAAFHLGKHTGISGGFKEGQDKPTTGLDSVPIRTEWKPGFAFTITYPLNR